MSENRSTASPGQSRKDEISQGITWIIQGWQLIQKQKSSWFGMTAIYLVLGFLLKRIPFMGDLLLILITPMLLAGVVWGCMQGNPASQEPAPSGTPHSAPVLFHTWVAQPAHELVRIYNEEEKVFGAVLLGIITLGLSMLVKITGYLLIGGSMLTGLTAGQPGIPQITTLLGMLVVVIMYVALAMGLFFSVPLTVLGNRQPFAAISESFSVCRKNAVPLLTLTVPFFILYLVILAVIVKHYWLGFLLVIAVGMVALPVFVAAVYRSYLTLHPLNHSDLPP